MKIKSNRVDVNSNLIEIARKKYPDACFEIKDILIDEIDQKFDYVVLSGVFNFKLSNNKTFIQNMLKKCLKYAIKELLRIL